MSRNDRKKQEKTRKIERMEKMIIQCLNFKKGKRIRKSG